MSDKLLLHRPKGLTDAEWEQLETHPLATRRTAYNILMQMKARGGEAKTHKSTASISKAKAPKTGYIARELVVLNLPYSKPTADVWARRNGELSLIVQGGYKIEKKTGKAVNVGVPYGATARLVLFYIMSAAAFSETRKIYLGNSFDAFLKTIGASPERRGLKTGARAVLNQLERLINASFKIQRSTTEGDFDVERIKALPLISDSEIWFSRKNAEKAQQGLWNSYVEISEELFQSLKKNPIPIDWDVVLKIRGNATALDFYALLTYESARAQAAGKGRFIPWASLHEQMGSSSENLKKFGAKARAAVRLVMKFYPSLKVSFPVGGIQIESGSLPSVASNKRLNTR